MYYKKQLFLFISHLFVLKSLQYCVLMCKVLNNNKYIYIYKCFILFQIINYGPWHT